MNQDDPNRYVPERYLELTHVPNGIGKWRKLYLELLCQPPLKGMDSLTELGSGSPDFLLAAPQLRKVAVDVSERYASSFEDRGIEFYKKNLDTDDLVEVGHVDIVICSDVFEHLLNPIYALANISAMVGNEGILISHVPNEFTLGKTLSVMMGKSTCTNFHQAEEWNDPHLRSFTKIGFGKFLQTHFTYNIPIQQLRYARYARYLRFLKLPVPYCLEGGPTFISTNNRELVQPITHAAKTVGR